jgi:hypothetical protein
MSARHSKRDHGNIGKGGGGAGYLIVVPCLAAVALDHTAAVRIRAADALYHGIGVAL